MRMNRMLQGMGALLATSMVVTEGLLLAQGRFAEAIPLHLCSLSAIMACAAAFGLATDGIIDFLWYLGIPGALLALVFPAPAVSRWQPLFNASYVITHALIVLIPLMLMRMGVRPRPGRTLRVMASLQGIALAAAIVNRHLDTNFLFLSLPPAGSPLVPVYMWGYPAYFLTLEALMLTLCAGQSALLRAAGRRTQQN